MLSIAIKDWSVKDLKQAVHDLDACKDKEPIAVENVTSEHVFEAIMNGELGCSYTVLIQTMRD